MLKTYPDNGSYSSNDVVTSWLLFTIPVCSYRCYFLVTVPEGTEVCYFVGLAMDGLKQNGKIDNTHFKITLNTVNKMDINIVRDPIGLFEELDAREIPFK